MNILMTGATGFLGGHLVPVLSRMGHNINILKRSFNGTQNIEHCSHQIKTYNIDEINIAKIFENSKIDTVIHLATDYGKKNNNNIVEMIEPNIKLPSQLLNFSVKYGIGAFVNMDTPTDSRYTLYSATKRAFLEIAKFYAANCEIKFVNLVGEYIYGEKDDNTKFIPFMIENILKGKEIKATKGEQKRDFIYVKDVVDVFVAVLNNIENLDENYVEFNIGTGQSISLKDFVRVVEDISGQKANINWAAIPYRKNEIFDSKADISTIGRILNWHPKVSLAEGVKNTISWYKNEKL